VGWYILAGRRSRDSRADIYAELVAGTIPSSGGSVKHPSVNQSDDALFRLWVPRDFAIARNLKIITDTKKEDNDKSKAIAKVKALMIELGVTLTDLAS
jgi:hypothetical protein